LFGDPCFDLREVHALVVLVAAALVVGDLHEYEELPFPAAPGEFRAVQVDLHVGPKALVGRETGSGHAHTPLHAGLLAAGEPLLERKPGEGGIEGVARSDWLRGGDSHKREERGEGG
jgi:hypothetical protein